MTAMSSLSDVSPTQFTGFSFIAERILSIVPTSLAPPIKSTLAPASRISRSATAANPSGSHRLVAQTDPGLIPTNLSNGRMPAARRRSLTRCTVSGSALSQRSRLGFWTPKTFNRARLRSTSCTPHRNETTSVKSHRPWLVEKPTLRGIPARVAKRALVAERWGMIARSKPMDFNCVTKFHCARQERSLPRLSKRIISEIAG